MNSSVLESGLWNLILPHAIIAIVNWPNPMKKTVSERFFPPVAIVYGHGRLLFVFKKG
jgi:hypothetical protein